MSPLIVPIIAEALLVNDKTVEEVRKKRPDFSALLNHGPAEPGEASSDEPKGIFLHWDAPTALRTGRPGHVYTAASSDHDMAQPNLSAPDPGVFPLLPNRWLVVRHSIPTNNTGSEPSWKFWLIRSDTPADDSDDEAAGTPLPVRNTDEDAVTGTYPDNIAYGAVFPLDEEEVSEEPHDWSGVDNPQFLTANSTGLPGYTFCQPHNQNTLSFHDSSPRDERDESKREITINYLVIGWYSHRGADPVNQNTANVSEVLKQFGWSVPDNTNLDALSITGTVYAGTVLGVPWKEDLVPSQYTPPNLTSPQQFGLDGQPAAQGISIAVGQSPIESCNVLLQDTSIPPEETLLFEAFLSNLLSPPTRPSLPDHTEETDPLYAFEYSRHDSTFTSAPGGQRWLLAPAPDAKKPIAQLTAGEIQELTSLNRAQDRYDRADRQVNDLVARLKGAWWISSPSYFGLGEEFPQAPDEVDTAAIKKISARLKDAAGRRALIGKEISLKATSLRRKLEGVDPPQRILTPTPLPPFRQVGNPVITVANAQDRKRSAQADGYLAGLLPVRALSGTPTSTAISLPASLTDHSLLSTPAEAALPTLLTEFNDLIKAVISGIGNKDINKMEGRGSGKNESFNKVAPHDPYVRWWRQPWRPAHLEWQADLYPNTIEGDGKSPTEQYVLTHENPIENPYRPYRLTEYFHKSYSSSAAERKIEQDQVRTIARGYSYILPILEGHTRYRLKHAAELTQEPEAKDAYDGLNQDIANNSWDLLSATLCGVNEALAGRKPDIFLPVRSANLPPDQPDDLTYIPKTPTTLPEHWFATPDPKVLCARVPHLPLASIENSATYDDDLHARGDDSFPATRSAQMRLTSLTIHDSYGRFLDLSEDLVLVAPPLFVEHSGTIDTRSYTHLDNDEHDDIAATALIDLRPRLHQGARLNFDYLSPTTGSSQLIPVPDLPDPADANPVHGWLMATRLGQRDAILCYTPQGEPLFDLHCIGNGPATARPLPGSRYTNPQDTGFKQHHPVLYDFLVPLLKDPVGDGTGALPALLSALQQNLTHIAPPSLHGAAGNTLALLIGRPCALATARLRLELDGPPLPSPTLSGLANDSVPDTTPWPVLLGDSSLYTDGLIGYYLTTDDMTRDFTKLHTPHPAASGSDPTNYTQQATPDDITLTLQDSTQPDSQRKDTYVTLLTCPHNSVHATTDILPVASLTLPPETIDRALSSIRPALPLGPLLTPTPFSTEDSSPILMPVPALTAETDTWQWAQPHPDASWTRHPLAPPQPTDEAPTAAAYAQTGYLCLSPEEEL
ncbi:hypothetical protein [Streptomyces sp. FIT100]|uniref:hypothetical protein n=1 Tax=Streptomyces sp. FIT100 TaxID=2837956 RepID=UPI0021C7CE92|nr:hypothetical protein [Streptomyces sp. FIT100]UUN30920.1 hypothetical protein KK483_34760 [Streptomyces sp. FIT100]